MNENEISRNQLTQMAVGLMGLKPKSDIYPSTHEMAFHCPFHVDKTPSMYINFDKGVYHCFSCGNQGSIESLYRQLKGESLYKALGISTDMFASYPRFQRSWSVDYSQENTALKNVYVNYDPSALGAVRDYPECVSYLRRRGIPLWVADSMGFRYIDKPTEINKTEFSRRLVIPIIEDGRLISMEGRKIEPSDEPKVLYPKNCTVNTLFDLDNLDFDETVYAVEGLMDLAVLRSSEHFRNSTAIFGASITRRQISLIGKLKKFVYIPDNDKAGSKTVAKLRKEGLDNVYVLGIPEEIDGMAVKDVGDFPKVGISPDDLFRRRWLEHETFIGN